jgi:hypothetical protein
MSLFPLPPSQNNFHRFHSSIIMYGYKVHPPFTPSFPLFLWPFLPLVSTPRKDLFFPPDLHFFKIKCALIVQGCFTLVLQVCINCAFIKITSSPPLLTHSLSPKSQQFSVQCIMVYSYVDSLFQYFSFSNIFFLSPTSHSHFRHSLIQFCSLCHCTYIYI